MRIKHNELDKYVKQGSGVPYFNVLKDDKDTANVRLLERHEDLLDIYAVHRVKVTGFDGKERTRYVGCLIPAELPCPLCNSGNRNLAKIYIHMLVDGEYMIWERGKNIIPKITGLFPRYGRGEHGLISREFEIQRNGAKGDTSTSYEFYPLDPDNPSVSFDEEDNILTVNNEEVELIKIYGNIILDWDAQTMTDYLNGVDVYNKDNTDEGVTPRKPSTGKPAPPASGREVF